MVDLPVFDSLAQGLGYASTPSPTTDALPTSAVDSSQHVMDSTNDAMGCVPVSLETKTDNAPLTGAFLQSNLKEDYWLNPEKPIY
jgi:hypothetical protein